MCYLTVEQLTHNINNLISLFVYFAFLPSLLNFKKNIWSFLLLCFTNWIFFLQGTTVRKALVASILITLLFLSRTVYNIISISPGIKWAPSFGFDWINVTDQVQMFSGYSKFWKQKKKKTFQNTFMNLFQNFYLFFPKLTFQSFLPLLIISLWTDVFFLYL